MTAAVKQAKEKLDAQVREVIRWHFNPETGTPFWLEKAKEFKFNLSKSALKKGVVAFKVSNGGALPHDFKVCSSNKGTLTANTCTGRSTPLVSPGQTDTLRVTFLRSGTYEYLCSVPGHAQAGMKGLIKVS